MYSALRIGGCVILIAVAAAGCGGGRSYDQAMTRARAEWARIDSFPRNSASIRDTSWTWEGAVSRTVADLREALAQRKDDPEAMFRLAYAQSAAYGGRGPGGSIPEKSAVQTMEISALLEKTIAMDSLRLWDIMTNGPRGKLTSEWGSLAYGFAANGKEDSMRWAFREGRRRGGFDDASLDYGRNLLASCPQDAILFVSGDMSTFAPSYVQVVEGLRQDVTVANLPLLNAPWYLEFIDRPSPLILHPLGTGIAAQDKERLMPIAFDSAQYVLDPPKSGPLADGAEPLRWTMTWTYEFPDDHGLAIHNVVTRDLIRANRWSRPICFGPDVEARDRLNLDPWLHRTGLVLQLVPRKGDDGVAAENLARLGVAAVPGIAPFRLASLRTPSARHDYSVLKYVVPSYSALFEASIGTQGSLPEEMSRRAEEKWRSDCASGAEFLPAKQRARVGRR